MNMIELAGKIVMWTAICVSVGLIANCEIESTRAEEARRTECIKVTSMPERCW